LGRPINSRSDCVSFVIACDSRNDADGNDDTDGNDDADGNDYAKYACISLDHRVCYWLLQNTEL
jgi:hypothetical protein